jgi:hypothetical protein
MLKKNGLPLTPGGRPWGSGLVVDEDACPRCYRIDERIGTANLAAE